MGTTTYGYDNAHELTSMVYPQNGHTETTVFANDADGRRTDAWLQSNATHTVWAAHEQFTYDTSGRIKTVLGQNGPATAPTTVVDETQCYTVNSTAPNCSTVATDDRSNVQSVYDSVTGETTVYAYDTSNRLHQVVSPAAATPAPTPTATTTRATAPPPRVTGHQPVQPDAGVQQRQPDHHQPATPTTAPATSPPHPARPRRSTPPASRPA